MENSKRQIVNIVNFIRGYNSEWQPFGETYRTVKNQIKLIDKYGFKATFLIQYDALTFNWYKKLMPSLDRDRYEVGVWFEVQKPLAEACGIKWRGRRNWDGHVHCGFSMGYTNEEKMLLLDKLFEQFKSVMGYYPRVLGSWFFDTFTARYVSEKYGMDAFCNCKEQYGTDGYTLWGGYYGQAYYPSRKNMFIPAQNEDMQIPVPIFKMLGSDQVYQFDFGVQDDYSPAKTQGVITLEPVYHSHGGGLPKWVDWYLKENFNGECLSFGYAQAGQENSFGWPWIGPGYLIQTEKLADLARRGVVTMQKLGDAGQALIDAGGETPATAMVATDAWDGNDIQSVWYSCRNYRCNLFCKDGELFFRDLTKFDDSYAEKYLDTPCRQWDARFDNLPVVDGRLWSRDGIECRLAFGRKATGFTYIERGQSLEIVVCFADGCHGLILLTPDGITMDGCREVTYCIGTPEPDFTVAACEGGFAMTKNGHPYTVGVCGRIAEAENGWTLIPEDGVLKLRMSL